MTNQYAPARALGNTGLNPFLGPSCRVKKSPSSRLIGPLGSSVPAVFGPEDAEDCVAKFTSLVRARD